MHSADYFFDNPASGEGHFPQGFANFFWALCRALFKPLFRFRAYNSEFLRNLEPGKRYILVGNHRSYLDPVFVMLTLRPRPVRFIAKEEFFKIGFVRNLAARVGPFPLKRNSADMSAVKRSVKMLKRGELLGIYPEGTRLRTKGQQVKYHEGVALIAQMAKASVVPYHIWGTDRISPKGQFLFRFPRISIRYGEPISYEDYVDLPKDLRFHRFTEDVMQTVYEMEYPYPDAKGYDLFKPTDFVFTSEEASDA